MISIAGLRKRFGGNQVLDGIDLSLRAGRITAIVGPNAAGKSTLIKCVLGLTRPDAGAILIDGKPVDEAGAYRASIGYMPQVARFPDHISGRDVIEMMADLRRGAVVHRHLIDALELIPHLDKPLRTLSGGTRQKINAVIAFMFEAPILILDEPSAGLDPISAATLKDHVLSQKAGGATVVLTSHVLSEIDELADDVAFLVDGHIRFAGPINDLKRVTRQFTLERAIAHVLRSGAAA